MYSSFVAEFGIKVTTLGRELFDNVLQTTGIREKWYFGLQVIMMMIMIVIMMVFWSPVLGH